MPLKISKYSKHDGRLFQERHARLPHEMRTKCERKVEIPLLFTTLTFRIKCIEIWVLKQSAFALEISI